MDDLRRYISDIGKNLAQLRASLARLEVRGGLLRAGAHFCLVLEQLVGGWQHLIWQP